MDRTASDDELVRRTLRQDREAFDLLLTRYQRLVYGIAYRVAGNPTDADDLVQAVFLRVYSGLKTFMLGTDFKSWLVAVAVNTSLNARKHKARQQELAFKAAASTPTEEAADPAAGLMEQEAQAGFERAISTLPEEQRVVLHLRVREGLSHEEIARILGCPVATVSSRIFLARKKLEGILRDRHDFM
ncbi:MAG: sigma-70 family RNA polymerase sigma factor [Planctomycetes bacterium]|nr:sigma-70 family RNA polymerase sigma factor [Planctomycetota bacterium]